MMVFTQMIQKYRFKGVHASQCLWQHYQQWPKNGKNPNFHQMMNKDIVYTYTMEYYSAIKKNEILPFATMWMELEGIMLSKISQSEKDKYHMTSLI